MSRFLGLQYAADSTIVLFQEAYPGPATAVVTFWLLLKVFATGCTALTEVEHRRQQHSEAVRNGVKAFREPGVKNAQRTLTVIILILAVLLAGISYSKRPCRRGTLVTRGRWRRCRRS